jgi:cardiolipin synthase C
VTVACRGFLILALGLSACATLRTDVPRVASHALPPDTQSPLGQVAGRVLDPAQPSSFRLLESGRAALAARLALAERARGSLDLQYYLFQADTSGQLMADALLRAADRGVRVRLLLDDVHTAGRDPVLVALDSHRNIQVRLYNPFRLRGQTLLGRAVEFAGDKARLNRRMHNKLFVADNQFGITGGRNIGDEYFQVEHSVAFRDLDVMAAGQAVRDMSAAFDAYWNSEHSVPARALPEDAPEDESLRARRASLEARLGQLQPSMAPFLSLDALEGGAVPGLGPWTPGRAEVVRDDPDKVAVEASPADLPIGRLLQLGQEAREEVLIASPYFVPGPKGTDLLRHNRQRGVRVRILTNSLSASDVALVHAGYARYRVPLLRAGVELHELKPRRLAPGVRVHAGYGSSRASLHTKAVVWDRAHAYVGSMNLDPRSVLLNTEGGLVLHGAEMAGQVARFIEADMSLEESYLVRLDPDSGPGDEKLVWLERRDGREERHAVEPRTGFLRRLLINLLSLLPIEGDL